MSIGRISLFLLSLVAFAMVLFFSLRPSPTPLRKEFTAPLPKLSAKWIRRSYPEIRHFPAYLVFAALLQLSVGGDSKRTILVIVSLLLLAAVLEIAQIWIPRREADVRDFFWSALGIFLGSLPWIFRRARTVKK